MSTVAERLNRALEGRYQIERELGQGGMATVYLARDLRHNRHVALKVLKPELAAVVGAERFLAEIETTANLQHPHILPLFDSGEADTFLFFVMPYVTGETLRERIDRERQLPVDEALGIATSVASALQHAHDRGVIHRDIKPGNIMLQDGQPVVGDFGIALAVGAAGGTRLTETGLSIGTPYYMSPEQATGDQVVGPASDTYALACVLYEMLIGEPPYPGATAQAVLGKIIQGTPVSATALRKSIPLNVDSAIRRALEKVPADRFTSAQAFAKALADPGFRHGDMALTGAGAAAGSWNRLTATFAGLFLLASAVAGWALLRPGPPEPVRRIERFAAPFLEGQGVVGYLGLNGFDLSPDGSMLVFRYDAPEGQLLMVRRWDDLSATPIRETMGAYGPAVSFDGLELAFGQERMIKVLAFGGGPVRTLVQGDQPEWGPDGYVYATTDSGAVRVPSTGGAPEYISRRQEGENAHYVRDVLPGGERVLLEVDRGGDLEIRGLDLGSGVATPIIAGSLPRYVPSGHLVYSDNSGTMMAARFDPERMELLGAPVPVMTGLTFWSISDDGKLFYSGGMSGGAAAGPTEQLAWLTRSGQVTAVDPQWTFFRGQNNEQGWSLSPDGSMVALREFSTQGGVDIWIKRLDTGPRSRLTFDAADDKMPVWEPGTQNVTFLSNRNGNFDVWSKPADGTGEAELILDLEENLYRIDWSPDGTWLLLTTASGDVLGLRRGVDGSPVPLLTGSFSEIEPAVSPDGRWLAYASNETGSYEVYVQPFPEGPGRWQVSSRGGRFPRWAHDGRELFFQEDRPVGPMWVVDVESASSFTFGTARVLIQSPRWSGSATTSNPYVVAPDDERFLIAVLGTVEENPDGGDSAPATVLVNNFFEELKRVVPE